MKGFVLTLVMLFVLAGQGLASETKNIYPSYAAAHAEAVKQNKRMFVMLTADWCNPCTTFKSQVLYNKDIYTSLSKYFIIYLIDVDKEPQTVALFKKYRLPTDSMPTLFFFSKQAKTVTGVNVGGLSLKEFCDWYDVVHIKAKPQPQPPIRGG
jgi:thioredoxin-related protein